MNWRTEIKGKNNKNATLKQKDEEKKMVNYELWLVTVGKMKRNETGWLQNKRPWRSKTSQREKCGYQMRA